MTTFKIPTLVVVQRLPSLASLLYNASYVVLPYLQHVVIVSNDVQRCRRCTNVVRRPNVVQRWKT